MHQFSDEFLAKWEHIIDDVDITDIPLECIKKVVIKLRGNRRRTINIQQLKQQGLELEQIEQLINQTLSTYGEQVRDLDWTIDVKAVAEIVQPQTEKILKGI